MNTVRIEIWGLLSAKASGWVGIVALTALVVVFLVHRLAMFWMGRRRRR